MLARYFAYLVMKSRWHASVLALLLGFVPFLGWLSSVVVGLVTLRRGWLEGAVILLWSLLPSVVLSLHGDWQTLAVNGLFGSFLVWFLAIFLRRFASWSVVLYMLTLFGIAVVAIVFLSIHDVQAWWTNQLGTAWQDMQQSAVLSAEKKDWQMMLQSLSKVATGLYVAIFALMGLVQLVFARALDGLVIGDIKRLSREMRSIRMQPWAALVLLLVLAFANHGSMLVMNLLPVLIMPFIVAGISVTHAWLSFKGLSSVWFFWFYFIIFLMILFLQFLLIIFVVIAIIDSIVDLRRRKVFFK